MSRKQSCKPEQESKEAARNKSCKESLGKAKTKSKKIGRNTVMCQLQRKKNDDMADKIIGPGFIEESIGEK